MTGDYKCPLWCELVCVCAGLDWWCVQGAFLPLSNSNRSSTWWRVTSVTPSSPLRISPLALAFILNDLTCGKLHQSKFSLTNSARRDRVYFWFCSTNRKLTTVEARTSVAAHGLISIHAALPNGKKKPFPSHTFCFSVKTPALSICGTHCGQLPSLFMPAKTCYPLASQWGKVGASASVNG